MICIGIPVRLPPERYTFQPHPLSYMGSNGDIAGGTGGEISKPELMGLMDVRARPVRVDRNPIWLFPRSTSKAGSLVSITIAFEPEAVLTIACHVHVTRILCGAHEFPATLPGRCRS